MLTVRALVINFFDTSWTLVAYSKQMYTTEDTIAIRRRCELLGIHSVTSLVED